jgi:replicative DNA helicase
VPANRVVFAELIALWASGTPNDLVLFTQHLRDTGSLNELGGPSSITQVYNFVPSPANFRYYGEILDAELQRRRFVDTAASAIREVEQGHENAIPEALSKLAEVPLRRERSQTLADAVAEKLDRLERGEPDSDIVQTGIECLDRHSPLRKGDMPLIGGERKAGKSILSLTIASNVAKRGTPVLYFSLEDRQPKVIDRLFAGLSRIPMNAHHVKRMTDLQQRQALAAASTLRELPLTIRDDVYDLHAIIAATRQAKATKQVGLVAIDYAQLIRASGADSRREEVERVSRELRLMAMELNIPVILLCQLNKEGETRETKALEMDATAMWEIRNLEDNEIQTERLLAVPWQRNGESGIASKVMFFGEIARVESPASLKALAAA